MPVAPEVPALPREEIGIGNVLSGSRADRTQHLRGCRAVIRRAGAITRREFDERRSRAAEGVRQSGLDALLVCSRGGGALDRYGDDFEESVLITRHGYEVLTKARKRNW